MLSLIMWKSCVWNIKYGDIYNISTYTVCKNLRKIISALLTGVVNRQLYRIVELRSTGVSSPGQTLSALLAGLL